MSYPPPPGTGSASLPPRPPPPAKRNHAPAPFTSFAPRSVASHARPQPTGGAGTYQAGPTPSSYAANPSSQQWQQYPSNPSYYGNGGGGGSAQADHSNAPNIRNPFAAPTMMSGGGAGDGSTYDPELEAQIAQWQSAYVPRDAAKSGGVNYNPAASAASTAATKSGGGGAAGGGEGHGHTTVSASDIAHAASADHGVASVITGTDGSRKTVVRSGGGSTWTDSSLLEWDPAHYRIFVGNLAGEVTDESLLKAFARFQSVQKARVVRDKRTTKSKGYGFVSFKDGDDYFQAAKEMQGKYIGSHPVLIKKSTTEIKAVGPRNKHWKHGKGSGGSGSKGTHGNGGGGGYGGNKNGGGGGSGGGGGGGGYLGANTGSGVAKKGKKEPKMKLLG